MATSAAKLSEVIDYKHAGSPVSPKSAIHNKLIHLTPEKESTNVSIQGYRIYLSDIETWLSELSEESTNVSIQGYMIYLSDIDRWLSELSEEIGDD
jgi:hypothetical protein